MAISAKQKQLRDQLTDKLVAAALDKAEAQRALAAADLKIAKLKKYRPDERNGTARVPGETERRRMSAMKDIATEYQLIGWNDALDELMDRLMNAEVELRKMIAEHPGTPQWDTERLSGKLQGVQLAYDYARGMKHS